MELRLPCSSRGTAVLGADGEAGDAKPNRYGDHLDALQLLERGVPDGVDIIEAYHDIERKLQWRPMDDLQQLT
ncbi:MAG: hypothetical protein U1D25_06130 [Hydrogenophaga sp.]|uniref:hypothetical protein n=1 Tax=Hydrogenophaga sp. TaxID=1904254 RepID=UPI002ABAADE8|nr:hypothetical protein [Hydrogenophaga sp.]MDZ4187672.1 hypothetical protein [Hydrogenophaga sp.]